MKIFFNKRFFGFILSIMANWAMAGGWSGNGGNGLLMTDNIWNLGSEPISYCIQVSSQFALKENEVSQLVKESLEEWQNFFKKEGLFGHPLVARIPKEAGPRIPNTPAFEVIHLPQVNFNFTQKSQCDLSQTSKDIRFFFGLKNEVISLYTKFSTAELKIGAAIRPDYDHKNYQNGGLVWIENFTNSPIKIKHALLHELGHIFGMKHDSVFVMSENVGDLLTSEHFNESHFAKIENEAWPFYLNVGERVILTSFKGKMLDNDHREHRCEQKGHMPNRILPPYLLQKFNLLPQGCHKMALTFLKVVNNKRIFELEVSNLRETKVKIQGEFIPERSNRRESYFPSVFTELKNNLWANATSHPQVADIPAKGVFNFRNSKIGAKIDFDKGITLELFFPDQGEWFSTVSY